MIGNGPSLLKTDLARLQGEVTIGSNGIFLLNSKTGFSPTFLTVEDRLVAEDRAANIAAVRGPTKIFPWDLSYCLGPDHTVVWVNFVREYDGFPRFSKNCQRCAYWGGTVSYLNLQLAHYLGAGEIYLVGFDHLYTIEDRIDADRVVQSTRLDVNHFDPLYFGPGFRYYDPSVERMERAYKEARAALGELGINIFNATVGGHLEVFPRRSLETVFGTSPA